MSNITPSTEKPSANLIEKVVIGGDLSSLSPQQRLEYYSKVCTSLGLNPLTKPFDYIWLDKKLTLYAKRDCTDQLRSIHKISITISDRQKIDDIYIVTAKAKSGDREDESTGAVAISGLKGNALANALMKAETKAKRRVTLSICGLGCLDESELETIPEAKPLDQKPPIKPEQAKPPVKKVSAIPDLDTYRPTFGRYKGKRLLDVDVSELANYVAEIEIKAKDQGKKIEGVVAEFISMATQIVERYLDEGPQIKDVTQEFLDKTKELGDETQS